MYMATEKQKMLRGELYDAYDPVLVEERLQARKLLRRYNDSHADQSALRTEILQELIGVQGNNLYIEPPFYCDYGYNIKTGDNVYFNFNCTILDVMEVSIGSNVLFGPSVHLYAATHPMDAKERAVGLESGKAINIGSDVWIGGGVIICPGVTIGSRSVIGAGSVVTRDIADDVFAAGNPCRPVRSLKKD
jgi:maltose O-acetyltransferase